MNFLRQNMKGNFLINIEKTLLILFLRNNDICKK
uniref:Uncharacterized protein n=1 Tax=Siphoviridae sp. ctX581 TaxID=2826365 RepID=A0A8S5MDE3_9CAUD|nr:MAG TPA: hypothetical protein [Siphoviridae sp. ctX581]DAX31942.1 MAG TPA: hypothetical protein [Caudoviricetes sp.]